MRRLLPRLTVTLGLMFVATAALMSTPGLTAPASASGYCVDVGGGSSGVTVCTP